MSVTRETQKKEAIKRLEALKKNLSINPNIIKYFKDDRIYYSYTTALGCIGSIDTIGYHPEYEQIVKDFEREYEGTMVYHAIEYGNTLSLLYVGSEEDGWDYERPDGKTIASNVYTFDAEKMANGVYEVKDEEFGTIVVGSMGGAIVRVG